GGEWPAMAENYWLPFAPILVIDLSSICCGNCWHDFSLLFKSGTSQPSCAGARATLTRQRIRQPSSRIHLLLPASASYRPPAAAIFAFVIGLNFLTAAMVNPAKMIKTVNCVILNGPSVPVGAIAFSAETFWKLCTTNTKTFK